MEKTRKRPTYNGCGTAKVLLLACVLAKLGDGRQEEVVMVKGTNAHPWRGMGRNGTGLGHLPASTSPYTVVPEGRYEPDLSPQEDPFQNARFYTLQISSLDNSLTTVETFPDEEIPMQEDEEAFSPQDGRAVCPNNPPFQALFASARDICRVYINAGPGLFFVCTGSFVSELGAVSGVRTFATSGHCVVDTLDSWNWFIQPLEENPSFVCCSAPEANGSTSLDRVCPISHRWRIRGVTVPSSYVSRREGVAIDDAAIFALSPYRSTIQDPVSYAWASISDEGICEGSFLYQYFGYPSINPRSFGCTADNVKDGFLHGSATARILNCDNAIQGSQALFYTGSSCPRMSGGPLLFRHEDNDFLVGILSGGTDLCSSIGTSIAAFARTVLTGQGAGYRPEVLIRGLRRNMRLSVS